MGIPCSGKGRCPLHSCLYVPFGGEGKKSFSGFSCCIRKMRGSEPRKRTASSTLLKFTPLGRCPLYFESLRFFECAGDFAEGEFISVVDRCCFVWLQALAVDACGVGAVQVGDCVGAADMLDGSVDA